MNGQAFGSRHGKSTGVLLVSLKVHTDSGLIFEKNQIRSLRQMNRVLHKKKFTPESTEFAEN